MLLPEAFGHAKMFNRNKTNHVEDAHNSFDKIIASKTTDIY